MENYTLHAGIGFGLDFANGEPAEEASRSCCHPESSRGYLAVHFCKSSNDGVGSSGLDILRFFANDECIVSAKLVCRSDEGNRLYF